VSLTIVSAKSVSVQRLREPLRLQLVPKDFET
jgi:hypothetical protein